MIEQFRKGDELYVWRLDRLGKSLKHIIDLVLYLSEKRYYCKRYHRWGKHFDY